MGSFRRDHWIRLGDHTPPDIVRHGWSLNQIHEKRWLYFLFL